MNDELNEKNEINEINKIQLQLGDIIKIIDPRNENLNDNIFFIEYIDGNKIKLINTDTLDKIQLPIKNNVLGDGTITTIYLLSRSEFPGYARQNNLTTNTWIDITFKGDLPGIITGEITNLEEDMIEITTTEGDIIYINFDYKGIPEDIPIDKINIRTKPEIMKGVIPELAEDIPISLPEEELEDAEKQKVLKNIVLEAPVEDVRAEIRQIVLRADQVVFGDEVFGKIVEEVEVVNKKFGIEAQTTDLLDELLATIPTNQRTTKVLNRIHKIIERYQQLRLEFSTFDAYGNPNAPLLYISEYKPLFEYYKNFKINLYWILPVIQNIKKIYTNTSENISDIETINMDENLTAMEKIIDDYYSNSLGVDSNKYTSLYKDLDTYFTPFSYIDPENKSDIITEKVVNTNINTVSNNLNNMYSSTFSGDFIKPTRFFITKYNQGLEHLISSRLTGSKMYGKRAPLTESDVMSIRSIMTLPEPTIQFSRVNLPGSTIIDKSNLSANFLNYWQLLKRNTKMNNVLVDNIDKPINFTEENFVNNIKNYSLTVSDEQSINMTKEQIYESFINVITPKTRLIFNFMKKYITGRLSIVKIAEYLEPFLIYTDNLSFMQYQDITRFINEKISEYNKNFVEKSKIFFKFKRLQSGDKGLYSIFSLFDLIKEAKNLRSEVFEAYNIDTKDQTYSTLEILRKMIVKDYGNLYNTALTLQSIPLMYPSEFSSVFKNEKDAVEKDIKNDQTSKNCNNIVIAKYYKNESELNADNSKNTIYFDKKYDNTDYGFLDQYEKELIEKTPEEFITFLNTKIKEKLKLSDESASYLSETLINGHKKVLDGQYAVLYNETDKNPIAYYVRKNNKWELDETINENSNTDDSNLLCDFQEKCISAASKNDITDKCDSLDHNNLLIKKKLMKNIIDEFDEKYIVSKTELEEKVIAKFEYYKSILPMLGKIERDNILKYNMQKYKIGIDNTEKVETKNISPYLPLRDNILSQPDFIKKQVDIIRFVNEFTRTSVNEEESSYWFYCKKTGQKLLPTFIFHMAIIITQKPQDYDVFMSNLKKNQGKLSDDGNAWVDKYSGWVIEKMEFSTEEGYEEGFRVSTRAVMEEDEGSQLVSNISVPKKPVSQEVKFINNIINTLSGSMGIEIESQKDFIIKNVLQIVKEEVESEKDYEKRIQEMAKKGKTIPSYNDAYNSFFLYSIFGMFLIAVQTHIPSVRTRKTFPGCVRSFVGYPFEGTGDMSSLNYLACVAYKIRSPVEPWNVLLRTKQEKIGEKIQFTINQYLLNLQDVKQKFEEKREHLLFQDTGDIPNEYNVTNWTTFLPPLVPFKLPAFSNITNEFKQALKSKLLRGDREQIENILVVSSKIIFFSLGIQEAIQNVLDKERLLLVKSNGEPYLENACCNEKGSNITIQYFEKRDSKIELYNKIVEQLTHIIFDIIHYSRAQILYSNLNTKNVYPPLSKDYSEETIYLSFIHFCHFNSILPINDKLLPICSGKPNFIGDGDSTNDIIRKLKAEGIVYSKDIFLRLLQVVGQNNIIHISSTKEKVASTIQHLNNTLEIMTDDIFISPELIKLMKNVNDTFEVANKDVSSETENLQNFLVKNIKTMKKNVVTFITKNQTLVKRKNKIENLEKNIDTLLDWSSAKSKRHKDIKISNDSLYNIISFLKNYITNIAITFPNIIQNKVDYSSVEMPKYYGLTTSHSFKIQQNISKYYEGLKGFIDDPALFNIINTIPDTTRNIVILSNATPAFSSINLNQDEELIPIYDENTSKMLFEYYLLSILMTYVELTDHEGMVVTEDKEQDGESNIYSTDYLDDVSINISKVTDAPQMAILLKGNKKKLRERVANLLFTFIEIMGDHKKIVNVSYEDIMDRNFKLKEKEKHIMTDRLKKMSEEERQVDNVLKINKLGMWGKGLEKGLTTYVKDAYDEESGFRDEMMKLDMELMQQDPAQFEENLINEEIEKEVYDMSHYTPDYMDGIYEGDEEEHFEEYD